MTYCPPKKPAKNAKQPPAKKKEGVVPSPAKLGSLARQSKLVKDVMPFKKKK